MTEKPTVLPHEDFSQTYYRQWVIFFFVVAALTALYWYQTHAYRPHPVQLPSASAQTVNWFYVLRMPEVQIQSDVRFTRKQFSGWIDALEREGFHFLLLSEVIRDVTQGKSLPEKTAVIVFDPGYHRTADILLPVLAKKHIPGVWLTNGKGIEAGDKRFISQHLAESMKASGRWDVGFYTPDAAVALKTRDNETLILGHRSPWKADAGRFALNRGIPVDAFDRLNVNAKWTDQDLVHRLLVERPVQSPVLLSLQEIQDRNWGIGLDIGSTHEARFTLRAPPDKRSGSLYWLGTTGLNDVHLRLEVKSLIGEMRILLRSDQTIGEDVSILFSRGKVTVEQSRNSQTLSLASSSCPDIAPNTPFTAVLAVMGRQLALAVNGHPLVALDTLAEPTSHKGMIRLVVQDSLKGVGEARSVQIVCTPLGNK